MKQDHITYQQVFRTFGIRPVHESSFCCLLKEEKRHFCVYHDRETGKIQCWYINALQYLRPNELLSLLSPYHDLQFVSLEAANTEYLFTEQVSSELMLKWCYGIRNANTDDDLPEAARELLTIFDRSKDIYMGEDNQVKLILRDASGAIADLLQYRDVGFEPVFSNRFGSWDDRPDTSSLLHHLYTTNPYLIPPFFEENNQYHYHTHVVSGYHFPEFTRMFIQLASDGNVSLEPSFFLLDSLKDYTDFIGFLCHYATLKSKKNFFQYYPYTDHAVLEIIPYDSPVGHVGLTFKSWQTMLSQKLSDHIPISKWQTGSGVYTDFPQKIDILHRFCLDFIHLNKLAVRIINHVLDVDAGDDQKPFIEPYDEQIF